jgi:curved DNA-binding protein CbpA
VLPVRDTRDPYKILQLHPTAVPEMVEAAYRTLARLHHPDRNPTPQASAVMAELNWAYGTLRNPELRAKYDQTHVAIPVDQPAVQTSSTLAERFQRAAASVGEKKAETGGNATLDFGRYAGMTLRQIARIEPGYLEWLKRHSSGLRYRHQIDEVLGSLAARRAGSGE